MGQLIDPVGGAGLGNAHLPGELGEGGALQQVDDIGGEGIGGGEPTGAAQQAAVDDKPHTAVKAGETLDGLHGQIPPWEDKKT